MARFRVVTKHQISGWRFLLHRIEHALVRRDASMIDDPQRGRSTALLIGVALACVCVAGAAVMAFFKPAKSVGDSKIVADKDTGALYVRVGDRLHPALNLTSARLVVGSADNPVRVSGGELSKYPRGPWVGIPGAPGNIVDSGSKDSSWAVCDTTRSGAAAPVDSRTGLPTATLTAPRTTAIGGPLKIDGETTRALAGTEARLLRDESTTWLVYADQEQGFVRAAIDLADSAVVLALGIDPTATVVAASKGLINAIPEAPPIRVPAVPGAGEMTTLSTGLTVPVGSVLTVSGRDAAGATYVVSQSGVVQVSAVLADMIRNADSQGAISVRTVGPDVIAANLRPGAWPGTATYPTTQVDIVEPDRFGVTCYHWSRAAGDAAATTQLVAGDRLPLPAEEQSRTVALVTAPNSQGATADAAYMPRTTGRFVQVSGSDPASPLREGLYWISDSGVRYGIAVDAANESDARQTLSALALRAPVPAPWSIVSLFAVGPTLSQADAKVVHDGIPVDKTGLGFGGPS
ncbi:type VII secretion protein EccB [Nocardia cyriacigeorgica]|uniref:type VII secretion protein EccB n=1 Tax=Nocardia cyriacigeorgica TaxID=135487 RepID=UPI0018944BEA|nr:type VII secretion protein EccB [Nocardia cyriacigeorgica]MBF6415244.1 type VII secretion protein EccB [Nocardia cyriacigeorgica]